MKFADTVRSVVDFRHIRSSLSKMSRGRRSLAVCSVVFVVGSVVVSNASGLFNVADSVSQKLGFSVEKVVVKGNQKISEAQIAELVATPQYSSLFVFDGVAAKDRVLQNPWLKSASVRKVYPDTLLVNVTERSPIAFWKSHGKFYLIARDGVVLGEASEEDLGLPQVVGDGANQKAAEILVLIEKFPEIRARMQAVVRIADRRWDIVLRDGPKVMLPEHDWQKALAELQNINQRNGLLDRDILQLDMRLADRFVIRMQPDIANARRENLNQIMKRAWHRT
ncbi:MAG: FtsQ-type POTRA domain-containing protein [Pseudomonadota bacterium]